MALGCQNNRDWKHLCERGLHFMAIQLMVNAGKLSVSFWWAKYMARTRLIMSTLFRINPFAVFIAWIDSFNSQRLVASFQLWISYKLLLLFLCCGQTCMSSARKKSCAMFFCSKWETMCYLHLAVGTSLLGESLRSMEWQ